DRQNRELQQKLRDQHSARKERPLLAYDAAKANRLPIDWSSESIPAPPFVGRRVLSAMPLEEVIPYIDWTFFFAAWDWKGRFPAILDHPQYGTAARDLHASAQRLLDRIVRERLLTINAVYGFWPASSENDDIVVHRDERHAGELVRFNMLRQQEQMAAGQPNLSLADFVGPRDYPGAFPGTAGNGAHPPPQRSHS